MSIEKSSEASSPPVTHDERFDLDQHHHHHHPDFRQKPGPGQAAYEEHGPLVDHERPQEEVIQSHPDLRWSRIRHFMREPFSEFWGVSEQHQFCQRNSRYLESDFNIGLHSDHVWVRVLACLL